MSNKITLLFIREDKQVMRLRLRSSLLWVLLAVFLLSLTVAAGASWTAWNYRLRYQEYKSRVTSQADSLTRLLARLERLENLENFLLSTDPETYETIFGNLAENRTTDQDDSVAGLKPESLTGQPADTEQPVLDLERLFTPVDVNQARIAEVSARIADADSLRVVFSIHNTTEGDTPLQGRIYPTLITTTGQEIVPDFNQGKFRYYIRRFKYVRSPLHLPDGFQVDDILALRLVVANRRGHTLLSGIWRLEDIKK